MKLPIIITLIHTYHSSKQSQFIMASKVSLHKLKHFPQEHNYIDQDYLVQHNTPGHNCLPPPHTDICTHRHMHTSSHDPSPYSLLTSSWGKWEKEGGEGRGGGAVKLRKKKTTKLSQHFLFTCKSRRWSLTFKSIRGETKHTFPAIVYMFFPTCTCKTSVLKNLAFK